MNYWDNLQSISAIDDFASLLEHYNVKFHFQTIQVVLFCYFQQVYVFLFHETLTTTTILFYHLFSSLMAFFAMFDAVSALHIQNIVLCSSSAILKFFYSLYSVILHFDFICFHSSVLVLQIFFVQFLLFSSFLFV